MSKVFLPIDGLDCSVDEVNYLGLDNGVGHGFHRFVYRIRITNRSTKTVRLFARKWMVNEEGQPLLVIEGSAIVGEKPLLSTGDEFVYRSSHLIRHNAFASCAFYGVVDLSEDLVFTFIPPFEMQI